jgi:hypothetical protein
MGDKGRAATEQEVGDLKPIAGIDDSQAEPAPRPTTE